MIVDILTVTTNKGTKLISYNGLNPEQIIKDIANLADTGDDFRGYSSDIFGKISQTCDKLAASGITPIIKDEYSEITKINLKWWFYKGEGEIISGTADTTTKITGELVDSAAREAAEKAAAEAAAREAAEKAAAEKAAAETAAREATEAAAKAAAEKAAIEAAAREAAAREAAEKAAQEAAEAAARKEAAEQIGRAHV